MAKFSVGDRVKCVQWDGPVSVGTVATVCVTDVDGTFQTDMEDGHLRWMSEDRWEIVTPAEPARPTRKIVQISVGAEYGLNALCDDGTVWYWSVGLEASEWRQLPPIPQPESV